jgi:hypothetical protein
MLAELADARELLEEAEQRLGAVVRPIADRHGVTEATVEAAVQALRREHGIVA